MLRKIATSVLLAGAFYAPASWALSLGEASLGSYIDQPLNAELPLNDVGSVDLSQMQVRLADRSATPASALLSSIRLQLMTRNGQAFIRATSLRPVDTTYLNFIVEVTWPQGSRAREYTLFFDPPPASVQLIGNLPAGAQAASDYRTPDRPFSGGVPDNSPAEPVISKVPAETVQTQSVPGKSVRVGRADTLWSIALKNRPVSGVSPQQVMLAFQRVNPDAFINGNINQIKRGSVLKIPSLQEIRKLNFDQALKEVARQNRLWRTRGAAPKAKAALTNKKAETPAPKVEPKEQGQLRLTTPKAEEAATATDGTGDGRIPDVNSRFKSLQDKLSLTQEELDKTKSEYADTKSQLADMQAQIDVITKLLTAKNEELAGLQSSLKSTQTDNDDLRKRNAELEAMLKQQQEAQAQTVEAPKEDEKKEEPVTPAASEDSLAGIPLTYLIAGAAALVALLIGLLLWLRKRSGSDEDSTEKIRRELEEQMQARNQMADAATGAAAGAAAAAYIDAQSMSEEPEFEEVDPLDGFDELFDEDLDLDMESPDPTDPFNAADDPFDLDEEIDEDAGSDIESEIEALAAASDPLADIDLDLDDSEEETSSLLEEAENEAAGVFPEESVDESAAEEVSDSDLDDLLNEAAAEQEEQSEVETSRQIGEFDEDDLAQSVSLDVSDTPEQDEEAFVQTLMQENNIASDEPDIDSEPVAEVSEATEDALPEPEDEFGQDDIDALLDQDDGAADDESIPDLEEVADLSELDDLDDVLVEDEAVIEDTDPNMLSLDEELDALLAEADQGGFVEEEALGEEDFTFLSGADEAATKLDLARAYLDMEDIDGARDILQEVMSEGSEVQQQEAQELLASLG
ncbi:FimV/HubP family polar landmark protein [Pokkaliibacter sp. CJK22405]|uniref:FimV/HubP family polar landmark protein n=1 Tax=Pokkaliibacter sp. CJK22405 TaxID=3384615 RepID=UPI003984A600